MKEVGIGIIGGGLMGREAASAFGRWYALSEEEVRPKLVAVADLSETARDWFRKIPAVSLLTADYHELLASPEVDVVYAAVPHLLHEQIYSDVLEAGKDLLAEKPFGIDLPAAERILQKVHSSGRFVRCSSEFPFLPGANRAYRTAAAGGLGKLIEVRSSFLHSSDINPDKAINWKRQVKTCGAIGVMGDLGMHALHVPLRLGWQPTRVFAQLQKIYHERPDGKGGTAACDTWDNATLHTEFDYEGAPVPMRIETKRIAPGETNTWIFEVDGTDGGVRFSTKEPKTLWTFHRDSDQWWQKTDMGHQTPFKTITGPIFETGFPDILLQMWAAYLSERNGTLGDRFACVTPEEALASHKLFAAALKSHQNQTAIRLE